MSPGLVGSLASAAPEAPVPIGPRGLVLGLVLVLLAGAISWAFRLDLERRLLWATLRAAVQLALIGRVLSFVLDGPMRWGTGLVVAGMVVAAAREARARPERKLPGAGFGAFLTLALVGVSTSAFVTSTVLEVSPWYQPRYLIPLLGMILGNALTGLSLALDQLLEAVDRRRADIEADLAAGATRWEAMREPMAQAMRRGLTPILNATSVVGVVSLPGMMTGQILAGADPNDAVRYQFVVMAMILGATAVGCLLLSFGVVMRVSHPAHRLEPRRWG